MSGGLVRKWDIAAAWDAAVATSASAFDVPAALIAAPSRGRGPRPPQSIWTAKKMAVHLTVIIADCDYASLGRFLGLHRDTVASHCADMREAAAGCDWSEIQAVALERTARLRTEQISSERTDALRAQVALMDDTLAQLNAACRPYSAHPTLRPTTHPTGSDDNENVITFPGTQGGGA
jgi:hypothetical protein